MDILIAQKVDFKNIIITCSDYEFGFDEEIQREIDKLWNNKVIEGESKGQKIRDWLNYYLKSYKKEGNIFNFNFWTVRFRNISMRNFLSDEMKEKTKNNQPKGVFVAWIVKTNDSYFLFPKRSWKDVTKVVAWEITTFGWVLQPDDRHVQNFKDIWEHMVDELKEELWIKRDNILDWQFIGLTLSKALNRGIIFNVEINLNHEEVVSIFEKNNDWEMSEVLCIHQDQIINFLTKEWFDEEWNYNTNLWLYRDIMIKTSII